MTRLAPILDDVRSIFEAHDFRKSGNSFYRVVDDTLTIFTFKQAGNAFTIGFGTRPFEGVDGPRALPGSQLKFLASYRIALLGGGWRLEMTDIERDILIGKLEHRLDSLPDLGPFEGPGNKTHYLVTTETPAISLEAHQQRIEPDLREMLRTDNIAVEQYKGAIRWTLNSGELFWLRVSDAAEVAVDAQDLAAFASSEDRAAIAAANTHFTFSSGGRDTTAREFAYLVSLAGAGHDSWCFQVVDREYVQLDFDKEALFSKERLPTGLSKEAPGRRVKLVRLFAEPVPELGSVPDDGVLLAHAADLPSDTVESFVSKLPKYGYEEMDPDEDGRRFAYTKNERWRLRAHVGDREVYFSVSWGANPGSSCYFEAYQACCEIAGDARVRLYDSRNREWFEPLYEM
jgi:hypothetical protein